MILLVSHGCLGSHLPAARIILAIRQTIASIRPLHIRKRDTALMPLFPCGGIQRQTLHIRKLRVREFPIQAGDEDTSSVFPPWGVVAICSLQHRQYDTPNKENLPAISSWKASRYRGCVYHWRFRVPTVTSWYEHPKFPRGTL